MKSWPLIAKLLALWVVGIVFAVVALVAFTLLVAGIIKFGPLIWEYFSMIFGFVICPLAIGIVLFGEFFWDNPNAKR